MDKEKLNFKLEFWKERKNVQVQLIEDDAIRDNVDYNELIEDKLNEGYVIVYQYSHPAVGWITIFEPDYIFTNESLLNVINKALTLEPEDPETPCDYTLAS